MTKKVYIDTAIGRNDPNAIICYYSSDRSDGKTTDIIRSVYDTFKQTGKAGVIARRYTGDITTLWIDSLFTNLKQVRPDVGALSFEGSPKKDGVHLFENGIKFADLIPLSRATAVKSAFDVKTHKDLYIDEYVPDDNRYLKGEVHAILQIWRTIDRDNWQNKIYVYSNHSTVTNPIFNYFGIIPRDGVSRWRNGRFLLLQIANEGNRKQVEQSPLGELVAGTTYGNYIQGGTLDNVNVYIQHSHSRGRLSFVLKGKNGTYGFYYSEVGLVIDRAQYRPPEAAYAVTQTNGKDGYIYIKLNKALYNDLKRRFQISEVFAASELIYEEAADIWKFFTT